MERHNSGDARVIPIILRHAYWKGSPFSKLQALPTNAEPIKDGNWRSIDAAFKDVAEGLEKVINGFHQKNIDSDLNPTPSNNGPKTIIVDQMHRGDFTTITDAIAVAAPGSRILVRSGVYDDGLIIDKPLEIVGEGKLGDVIIRAVGKSSIFFNTVRGKISNLLIRQNGGGDWYGVDITQGCLELDGCDIASDSRACIAVHGNAYPRIVNNKIHDGKTCGVYVYENGQGVIESNEIYSNEGNGLLISNGGNPTIIHNKIYNGKGCGVYVSENGQGVLENNEIYRNASSGVAIYSGGNPKVIRNKIHDGRSWGIFVSGSQGVIEDNDIFGNERANIGIFDGGNPRVVRNMIHDGKSWGVFVDGSQGVIEDNDINNMGSLSIHISEDGNPIVKRNRITHISQ
jgi:parallel beta-helix repeat protein